MKKGNLLKSTSFTIVLVVVVTLISSSSLSVTLKNISNNKNSNLEAIEKETSTKVEPSSGLAPKITVENPKIPIVSFGETMWGYIVNSSVFDEGTCYFDVDDPGSIAYLQDTESDDFLSGGTGYWGNIWIACEHYSGALWEIDPETGDMIYIGGGGVGLNGLATDWITSKVYGASGSDLYLVDPEDGIQELIGSFGSGINDMIAIACDSDGVLYGWNLGDKLWTIDTENGEATEVGPLGIDINYAQDGGFDMVNDILYLTAFTISPYYGSYLYKCDKETGQCTLIGQLEGNSQITASVIHLGYWCCEHDVGINKIISPKDGDAGEDMEVIINVRNYGNNTEEDITVNVAIFKDGVYEEYNETVYIDIDYGETVNVEMPMWTPDDWQNTSNEYIDYIITAQITLEGDNNFKNNYKEEWFELYFGYFHDVGCTNVIKPKSGPAQTFPVNATIKNLGQYDECCFKTYVEIAELDIENPVEILTEDFSDFTFPPEGWTRTHENWKYSNSNYSGGSSGEARFYYYPKSTDYFRLYTPAIDTSDYGAIEIEFKHYVDHNTTPYTLQVETSEDGIDWDVVWNINPTSNIGPEIITILTTKNVGSTTYISWTFNGNSSNIDNWYIDDIVINGYTSFYPEYQDNRNTSMIEPGKENELEFNNWTPNYLQYETTGTKKYIVKAWTDMNNPPDENPDNDLFVKSIVLNYFHDVGIKEVVSPTGNQFVDCLHYDNGENVNALAPPCGCTWEYAIRLTPAELAPWAGYEISVVKRHHGYVGSSPFHMNGKMKIYGQGISSSPGELLSETPFEVTDIGWHDVELINPVPIAGDQDIWVSCQITHKAGEYPTGMDPGPYVPGKSDWLYLSGYWSEAHSYGFDTNWNLWAGITEGGNEVYIPMGTQNIKAIAENIGTFPEKDMTCYAEINEFYTNCSEGTLVYEDNITDIDILTPLTGTKLLNFDDYDFQVEGLYRLDLNLVDDNDDYLDNNQLEYMIGCDATPPDTTYVLNPPAPDGLNDWYISDVEVTLTAKDPSIGCDIDGSGIKEIKYQIDGGAVRTLPGDTGTFTVTTDSTMHTIKYWSIDNVGNQESQKTIQFKQDQTPPKIDAYYRWSGKKAPYLFTFTAYATDATSGMERVEFWLNWVLQETIVGPGPEYVWAIYWVPIPKAIFWGFAYDMAGLSAYDEFREKIKQKQSFREQ